MQINIITEKKPGWVLRRIAEEYDRRFTTSHITDMVPDGTGDVNLYINYALMKEKSSALDVGWFTHKENDDFDRVAEMADLCIAMCMKTALLLPEEKTVVIKPCADKQFLKKDIIFGCVGRDYKTGRKGFDLIENLRTIPGAKIMFTNQQYDWREMPDFYNAIDYLLVLSSNEGGPMPVLEAIARGKPVIAPNVGWCWDYPVIKYTDNYSLIQTIERLITPPNGWELSAKMMLTTIREFYGRKNQ